MAWWDGKLRGTKGSSASKFPIPLRHSRGTRNLTALDDSSCEWLPSVVRVRWHVGRATPAASSIDWFDTHQGG